MACFPNGSSGDHYLEKYCFRCTNWRDLEDGRGPGCPIWDLHLTLDYNDKKNPTSSVILDSFIPMDKEKVYPLQCVMFLQVLGEVIGQSHFDFVEIKK